MKKMMAGFLLIILVSCAQYIDKPKNLIDKSTMSELIAELSLNDQVVFMYRGKNLESGTRYVLKAHQVKPEDFVESYKYYVVTKKMNDIVDDAQKIILEKDPKADKYVKDKLEKNQNIPAFAR
ncbi:DUF4296 domain-containing protein [Chryseobacterium sp. GMJ5]|uniref:DUF4296 domain-containing protein n=1 Tax=Chryseobacterium gilvum TaxID=2976534 RepID=A0ABT2VWQ7_9FLAO|nr:DUF4296 domain-containing protein [Chryseobacterium gilvum]MCU7614331.1 DUF4296 domain-containing protein [Chryseobacterium gilvum]